MRLLLLIVSLLFTCAAKSLSQSFSLYLIGDCGEDMQPGPALQLLEFYLNKEDEHSAVIFLGDNSYPKGLFPPGSKKREESELKLHTQLDRVKQFFGSAVMIPGNHDWKKSNWGGLKQVQEEEKFVHYYWSDTSFHISNKKHCFLPQAGFPGPASLLLDSTLKIRLIAFDAQWWLQRQWFHKAGKEEGKSYKKMSDEFFIKLRSVMNEAESNHEQVILASHHPLLTAGEHGVRKTVPYILATYTPLIIFRPMGLNRLFRQDITSNSYGRLIDSLTGIINEHHNVIYVSGHDHNLQYFNGEHGNVFIVSGAGSKTNPFAKKPSSTPLWGNDDDTGFFHLKMNASGITDVKVFTPKKPDGEQVNLK